MATLDDDDKKWLLDNFVTKDESSNFASKADISRLEKGQNRLEKKLDTVSNKLDKDNLATKKRVEKIENHLGMSPPEF